MLILARKRAGVNLNIQYCSDGAVISGTGHFSLRDTFNCGQCFRFKEEREGVFAGVVGDKFMRVEQIDDSTIKLCGITEPSINEGRQFPKERNAASDSIEYWIYYFDLLTDYEKIKNILSSDATMERAIKFGGGIRVLNQPPFETLLTFIISQNNNIRRISSIVERLCHEFGEEIAEGRYAFPVIDRLKNCSLSDFGILRAGFRDKYLYDAVEKIASGELDLQKLYDMNTEDARTELTKIRGVGRKVADCVLLFSLEKRDVCPTDVWIKRALEEYYGGQLPDCCKGYEGIAQQFLFHYARNGG